MTDDLGEPLFMIAQRRVGMRRAVQVLTFLAAWDRAREALGAAELTLVEYREWWRVPERSAYRDQARFREAFPDELTPDRLLDRVAASGRRDELLALRVA